jgi:DNA phosphorothioation-dependent restriction protein DptG
MIYECINREDIFEEKYEFIDKWQTKSDKKKVVKEWPQTADCFFLKRNHRR